MSQKDEDKAPGATVAPDEEKEEEEEEEGEEYEDEEEEEEEEYEDEEEEEEDEEEEEPKPRRKPVIRSGLTPRARERKTGIPRAQQIFAKWARGFRPTLMDFLRAWDAMPFGFRPSTLAKYQQGGGRPSLSIIPALEESGLRFRDLEVDPRDHVMVPRTHTCLMEVRVVVARNIPLPGVGVRILTRRLRVCLWDKERRCPASNVITMPAQWARATEHTWSFTKRVKEPVLSDPGPVHENKFIVCDQSKNANLAICIECGILYTREGKKKADKGERPTELQELSCGWTLLPIYPQGDGESLNKKRTGKYEQDLHGGTPYDGENAVHLDAMPDEALGNIMGMIRQMGRKRRNNPHIIIDVQNTSSTNQRYATLLPDTIVLHDSSIELLALYRQMCADALVRQAPDAPMGPIFDPALAAFPQVLDDDQVFEALKYAWQLAMVAAKGGGGVAFGKAAVRRKDERKKDVLRQVIMGIAPLLFTASSADMYSHSLDKRYLLDDAEAKARAVHIAHYVTSDVLTGLNSNPDALFAPFTTRETGFDLSRRLTAMY